MIILSTLKRPTNLKDASQLYLFPDGRNFYDAHKNYLKYAQDLGSERCQHYWYAVHTLNFSVECFLKYAYSLIANQSLEIRSLEAFKDIQLLLDSDQFIFRKRQLNASSFSHNLKNLSLFFTYFTDAYTFPIFSLLCDQLPNDEKWVSERYNHNDDEQLKNKFVKYEASFIAVLKEPNLFGGIS